jgi:hypothetical protein
MADVKADAHEEDLEIIAEAAFLALSICVTSSSSSLTTITPLS